MKSKEIVLSLFPGAKQESHVTGFPRRRYYLIRNNREYMYMAEGETAAKAWKNALPIALGRAKNAIEKLEKLKAKNL